MYIETYDSLSSFVAHATTGERNPTYFDGYGWPSLQGDRERNTWAQGTWEEVAKTAEMGWIEGAEQIQKMAVPILEKISNRILKPEIVQDIEGSEIDIGAYLSRDPEPFLRWTDTEVEMPASGRIVHICFNVTASAFFSTGDMYKKGAAVSVLVDALEMTGRRVILDVAASTRQGMTVRIKNAQDPLDMESIAFTCAHAGFFRRLMFAVWEMMPGNGSCAYYLSPREIEHDADIYVGSSHSGKIEDPAEWAMEQLTNQGVIFNS